MDTTIADLAPDLPVPYPGEGLADVMPGGGWQFGEGDRALLPVRMEQTELRPTVRACGATASVPYVPFACTRHDGDWHIATGFEHHVLAVWRGKRVPPMTSTVDTPTPGPRTALHAWLVVADGIRDHGMPAPAGVVVYDGTDPDGPKRLASIDLHTPADAAAWADHLGLRVDPSPTPWAASYRSPYGTEGMCWDVRCMVDRSRT